MNKLTLRIQPYQHPKGDHAIDENGLPLKFNYIRNRWENKKGKISTPLVGIELPIHYSVRLNGLYCKKGSLDMHINPEKWDYYKQCAKGNSKEASGINHQVKEFKDKIDTIFKKLNQPGRIINVQQFAKLINTDVKLKKTYTVLSLFDDFTAHQKQMGVVEGTLRTYKTVRGWLVKLLLAEYAAEDIMIEYVDPLLINKFAHFITGSKGTKKNYVMVLTQFFSYVQRKSDISKVDPGEAEFDFDVKMIEVDWRDIITRKKSERAIKYYSHEEIEAIKKYYENTKDPFIGAHLFQMETGMAIKDVICFQENLHVIRHVDGRRVIKKIREKNSNKEKDIWFEVPLSFLAESLLRAHTEEGVFTYLNRKTKPEDNYDIFKRYLKDIEGHVGCKLLSHKARHTFGTIMAERGVPVEVIQKMMGHTDIKTTQIYSKITTSRIISAVDRGDDSILERMSAM